MAGGMAHPRDLMSLACGSLTPMKASTIGPRVPNLPLMAGTDRDRE